MNVSQWSGPIKRAGGLVRAMGVGLVILGALCIWAPQMSGLVVSVVVGVLLILGGLVRISFAWVAPGWGSAFLRFAFGVFAIIAGGYMVAQPELGSRALAIVLMVYFFADGLTALLLALQLRPVGGGAWMLLSGLASLLVGAIMWTQWPASGEWAIGLLIAIKLLVDGATLIGLGTTAIKHDEILT